MNHMGNIFSRRPIIIHGTNFFIVSRHCSHVIPILYQEPCWLRIQIFIYVHTNRPSPSIHMPYVLDVDMDILSWPSNPGRKAETEKFWNQAPETLIYGPSAEEFPQISLSGLNIRAMRY